MYYFNAPFWSGGGLRGGCDNSVADVGKSFESSSSSQSNNIRSSSNGSSSVVNANIDALSSPSVSSSSSSSSSSPSVSSSSSLVMSVSHGPVYFTTRPLVEVSLQQTSTKAEAGATTKADPGNRSKKTRRRQRTSFSDFQLGELERLFISTHYPDVTERHRLGERAGIQEGTVQVWFQNRRAKWRRQKNMGLGGGGGVGQQEHLPPPPLPAGSREFFSSPPSHISDILKKNNDDDPGARNDDGLFCHSRPWRLNKADDISSPDGNGCCHSGCYKNVDLLCDYVQAFDVFSPSSRGGRGGCGGCGGCGCWGCGCGKKDLLLPSSQHH